jgi:hypothetical protein
MNRARLARSSRVSTLSLLRYNEAFFGLSVYIAMSCYEHANWTSILPLPCLCDHIASRESGREWCGDPEEHWSYWCKDHRPCWARPALGRMSCFRLIWKPCFCCYHCSSAQPPTSPLKYGGNKDDRNYHFSAQLKKIRHSIRRSVFKKDIFLFIDAAG